VIDSGGEIVVFGLLSSCSHTASCVIYTKGLEKAVIFTHDPNFLAYGT